MQPLVRLGVFAIICFGISLADVSESESKIIDQQCFEEAGINQSDLNKAFVKHFKLSEGNAKINQFVGCVWTKHGYMTANGVEISKITKLVNDTFAQSLASDEDKDEKIKKHTDQTMKICGEIQGNDIGLTAVRIRNCILDHVVKFGKKGYSYITKKSLLQ